MEALRNNMKSLFKKTKTRGFTLLLAALVASIVLSLGSAIFSIAQKQVTLSSLGRDSQFAFYAADAAAECALYWDIRHNGFGTTSPATNPVCDGEALDATGRAGAVPYTMEFQINLFEDLSDNEPGYCADVEVRKTAEGTVIHADGYSVHCAAIETSSRSLQRSVELKY